MKLGIEILNENFVSVDIFEKDFFDLRFSEHLDGIGTGSFTIPTQSNMLDLLQPGNSIRVIDLDNSDELIFAGFIRPFDVGIDVTTIQFNEMKDRLNFEYCKQTGNATDLSTACGLSQFAYDLQCGDAQFVGVEYRTALSIYSLFDEVAKVTGQKWKFDGETITWYCLGPKRDIEVSNNATPDQCGAGTVRAENITATFAERYNKVIGFAEGVGTYIAGTGDIETFFEFQVNNMTDLQNATNNKLTEGLRRVVIKFDIIGSVILQPGDRIDVFINGLPDIFNTEGEVTVLKIEGQLQECNLIYNVWISDIVVPVRDQYNILFNIENRLSKLQTR